MIVEENKTADVNFVYVNDSNGGKFKVYLCDDGSICIKSMSEYISIYIADKNHIILKSE